MTNDIIEQMTAGGQASYEAIQQLGAINTKTIQKLTDIQFSLATMGVESSIEQMKLINNTNNYTDLISAESDLASTYSNKVIEVTRQAAEVLTESQEEIAKWAESNTSTLTETKKPKAKAKAKKTAKRTAKKA